MPLRELKREDGLIQKGTRPARFTGKDVFKTALERYGSWPVSFWELNYQDNFVKKMKELIGDSGDVRKESWESGYKTSLENWNTRDKLTRKKMAGSFSRGKEKKIKHNVSIFNPELAIRCINLYAPPIGEPGPRVGTCYDPFAGGGTRAIVAAKSGMDYVGVEIRLEEIVEIHRRAKNVNVNVKIIEGDSQSVPELEDESADFLLTCPPYYNLEKYNGGKNDLSMAATYEDFLDMINRCVVESYRILKEGAYACWVIGLHRDKNGNLLPMHHDLAFLAVKAGFSFREEVILNLVQTGAMRRVGMFDKGNHLLIRVHEYLLVFKK